MFWTTILNEYQLIDDIQNSSSFHHQRKLNFEVHKSKISKYPHNCRAFTNFLSTNNPVFQFHGLRKNVENWGLHHVFWLMETGLCIVKLYLCASKPPSLKSLFTPRIKAEVIYNTIFYMSTSQWMIFKICRIFNIHATKFGSAQNKISKYPYKSKFQNVGVFFFLKLYPHKPRIDMQENFSGIYTMVTRVRGVETRGGKQLNQYKFTGVSYPPACHSACYISSQLPFFSSGSLFTKDSRVLWNNYVPRGRSSVEAREPPVANSPHRHRSPSAGHTSSLKTLTTLYLSTQ
jgi:hypothetical protein